jgi:hypothetical protein
MDLGFHPYSKSQQLGKSQKDKDLPKFKVKKPKKKKPKVNKNIEMFHNRRIPHWKQRGKFSSNTRNDILREWGEHCWVCKNPNYQIHHVYEKGFGKGGRGVKTNGLPLCIKHHTDQNAGIHFDTELAERVEKMFIDKWGEHYYKDAYDLWMEGLIENPTDELYKKFMSGERERIEQENTH